MAIHVSEPVSGNFESPEQETFLSGNFSLGFERRSDFHCSISPYFVALNATGFRLQASHRGFCTGSSEALKGRLPERQEKCPAFSFYLVYQWWYDAWSYGVKALRFKDRYVSGRCTTCTTSPSVFFSKEIDPLLDKCSGFHSVTHS